MLCCFREVKCKQDFTMGILYYLYNALGLPLGMCISSLMISESEIWCGDARSFPGRGG